MINSPHKQHSDFVTAVAFHPTEDRLFLSGSFDRKLRLWDIPDHKVCGFLGFTLFVFLMVVVTHHLSFVLFCFVCFY